jgi:hypothetical protein
MFGGVFDLVGMVFADAMPSLLDCMQKHVACVR